MQARTATLWDRFSGAELRLCHAANGICRWPGTRAVFAAVSRLGNGVFWYTLMVMLPLVYGPEALRTSLHMLAVSGVCLLLYKLIKPRAARPRPCAASTGIDLGAAPLDLYSFPSGHTLHAVAFSLVACAHHPELSVVLVPFTVLVALSRVVLGLHYPTDVAVGALLGALVAALGLQLTEL